MQSRQISRLTLHLCAAGALFIGACDEGSPTIDPNLSAVDFRLCELLGRPLQDTLMVFDTVDSVIDTTELLVDVYRSANLSVIVNLDSLWYQAHDTTIAASYDTLAADTTMLLTVPRVDTTYALATIPAGTGVLVLAFDSHPRAQLLSKSGNFYAPMDSSIALAAIAGCYASLRTRLEFADVPEGNYLLRLIRTESFQSGTVRMAIVRSDEQ